MRSRDLPVCSIVPQPLCYRVPLLWPINSVMHSEMWVSWLVYCCVRQENETHIWNVSELIGILLCSTRKRNSYIVIYIGKHTTITKSIAFLDVMLCHPADIWHFRGTYCLHHQGWRVGLARKQPEAGSKHSSKDVSSMFLQNIGELLDHMAFTRQETGILHGCQNPEIQLIIIIFIWRYSCFIIWIWKDICFCFRKTKQQYRIRSLFLCCFE
jgi:hypothetical protein